jgi:hypothetical protein
LAFFSAGALADAAVSPSLSSATTRFLLALALALAAGAFFGALAGEAFFFAAACRGDARQRVTHEAPKKTQTRNEAGAQPPRTRGDDLAALLRRLEVALVIVNKVLYHNIVQRGAAAA